MAKLVLLELALLFDPANTWQHTSQFESFLAKAFNQIGLEAEVVKSAYGDAPVAIDKPVLTGRRTLFVQPTNKLAVPTPKQQTAGRPKTVQGKINELRKHEMTAKERDFKKGQMLSRKGYLKK